MKHKLSKITLAMLSATSLSFAAASVNAEEAEVAETEVIEVTGIRSALTSALAEKRETINLVEVIEAVDIGKLPDQNLAEVLENVTGVQITRTAGVGTGVQIRGTDSNRVEINGVSTVGSGATRSGINFEDVSAGIIAGIEVTKAPSAKTIEGSVGGTVNLRTIRPLELESTLLNARLQGEDSNLSSEGDITPRVSASYGDNWDLTSGGKFGVVLSASYSEQDVTAFRPRVDRDNSVASDSGADSAQSFDFLPIQFLVQDLDNFEFETQNYVATFEYAPNDNTKFYFDAVINEQERRQRSSRVQASGVSNVANTSIPATFEVVDFGSLGGVDLGTIQAATSGILEPNFQGTDNDDPLDPNLRLSTDTNSRLTESEVFRLGGEWQGDKFKVSAELSSSNSDTTTPNINTTLNFLNPNPNVTDNIDITNPNRQNESNVPFIFDLRDGLTFAVATPEQSEFGVTAEQLLTPANVALESVSVGRDAVENSEEAFRTDVTYYLDNSIITSIDAGYRYSVVESTNQEIGSDVNFSLFSDAPTGDLFSNLLIPGPTNFDAADGRELFVENFLIIDPELIASNPDFVISELQDAITEHGGTRQLSDPSSSSAGFFSIEEKTHAFYTQANFEAGIFRGNFGFRYLQTDIESTGNSITEVEGGDDIVDSTTLESDYDFFLPRVNIVADISDTVVARFGYTKDIRRPDFDNLSSSTTFETSENESVVQGNPALLPEEVESFDLSFEWYFAEAAVFSAGAFYKTRSDLHVSVTDPAFADPDTNFQDIDEDCVRGGIFNPIANRNTLSDVTGQGLCVDFETTENDTIETIQKGLEFAFQYDLSSFEDDLGWASGFGVLANYTIQEFSGGEASNNPSGRAQTIFELSTNNPDVVVDEVQGLLNLSETAYNFTLYYEKHGWSARARYTWREAYRTDDGSSGNGRPFGFNIVQEDRGQLNASINYDITDQWNIGIEAVNLTESEVEQSCVNEGALTCFEGLTDRRITFGITYNL